jgi:two-component system chemotaxis response regulator CheB
VREASHGEMVLAGTVYIAPSGEHLLVQQNESNQIMLYTSDAPPVNSCKPAVDVLFASAAENLGRQLLVVVLTGMGEDGLNGVRALRKRGKGYFLIQDEKSSLVWGMPGAIVKSGLADEVLSPAEIAGRLKKLTGVC